MSYVKWEQMLKHGGEKALSLLKKKQDYFKESFKRGKWHFLDPKNAGLYINY